MSDGQEPGVNPWRRCSSQRLSNDFRRLSQKSPLTILSGRNLTGYYYQPPKPVLNAPQ